MILVTGATGFLGRHVCARLERLQLQHSKTSLSLGLDLRDCAATLKSFESLRPRFVINCAAFVGGIQYGYRFPAELFHNNISMTLSLLTASKETGVARLVNPISNCAYPARATLFREDEFWDGPLHESVLAYGFARKAACVGGWAYAKQYGLDVLNIVLSNMYGPDDHFDEARSHALGALVKKIVEAKIQGIPRVIVWGTGQPVREWLHVEDGAEALVRAIDAPADTQPVNVGVASGISVIDLARLIADAAGYDGDIVLDPSKPDGAPYKTVDGSRGERLLGWRPTRDLATGVRETVDWYLQNRGQ